MTAASPAAERASGSSFYLGMRILPPAQREAMFEIYSFCRAVDDIADDPGPRETRRAQLAKWRADIDALYRGAAPPQLAWLDTAVRAFDPNEDFLAIIDLEMDVVAAIRAPTGQKLDIYCDRVASAVGRISVRVFGKQPDDGRALRTISAAPCNSPIFCATSARTRRSAGFICRATFYRRTEIAATDPRDVTTDPAIAAVSADIVELRRQGSS